MNLGRPTRSPWRWRLKLAPIAPPRCDAPGADQALRVVQCCLRTSERLVEGYPDEPAYRVRLSEAWTQAGKANWSARHHEQAEAAPCAAAQVADQLAEALAGIPPAARGPAAPAEELPERTQGTTEAAARERAKE